jgi:hypothetical protein
MLGRLFQPERTRTEMNCYTTSNEDLSLRKNPPRAVICQGNAAFQVDPREFFSLAIQKSRGFMCSVMVRFSPYWIDHPNKSDILGARVLRVVIASQCQMCMAWRTVRVDRSFRQLPCSPITARSCTEYIFDFRNNASFVRLSITTTCQSSSIAGNNPTIMIASTILALAALVPAVLATPVIPTLQKYDKRALTAYAEEVTIHSSCNVTQTRQLKKALA